MTKQKREIIVKEGDQQIYEGPDRRFYDKDYPKLAFGMPIDFWIRTLIYIGGIVIFLVKCDQRINVLEVNQGKQTVVLDSLVAWTQNADAWNSAQFGVQFRGGRPLNDRFDGHGNKGYIQSGN